MKFESREKIHGWIFVFRSVDFENALSVTDCMLLSGSAHSGKRDFNLKEFLINPVKLSIIIIFQFFLLSTHLKISS